MPTLAPQPAVAETFAEIIEIAMLAKGLTADALAALLGKSPQAVQTWTSGRSIPHPKVFPALADALGLDVENLARVAIASRKLARTA